MEQDRKDRMRTWLKKQMERVRCYFVRGGYHEEWRAVRNEKKEREEENSIVINVSFQREWTVTVMQDLG